MISKRKRALFGDLYRLAECYECPPFKPGDIDGNAKWFMTTQETELFPFLRKYQDMPLAAALAMEIVNEASMKAAEMNKEIA